jgi:plastocyanin/cytochrome c5
VASSWLSRARKFSLLLLVFIPAILIGLQQPPPSARGVRIVDVVAAVPEAGGFQPDSITVHAGQRLRLRFRAADVAHGVAIGPGLGIDLGDLAPGEVKTVDVTFPEAGTFTFYCNKWCSPNHWRMRGVIAVQDRDTSSLMPQHDPVIDNLVAEGIDIDAYLAEGHAGAPHESPPAAAEQEPSFQPSAVAGAIQIAGLAVPAELQDVDWRRRHTPLEGEALLLTANPDAERSTLANVIAYLWAGKPESAALAPLDAATLYSKNCAACHGESGDGQGFDAGASPVAPPSFADSQRMAVRRSDVLYAKIRRGGMGTGMPNFGTLLTPEETWGLVEHLWRLAFDQ